MQEENNHLNADNNSIQHSTITINAVALKPPGTLKNEVTGSVALARLQKLLLKNFQEEIHFAVFYCRVNNV